MRSWLPRLLLLGLAAASAASLATCDDAPRTSAVRAVEDPWALIGGAGLVPVVVLGRPVAAEPEAVRETVFRAVEQAVTWTATTPFVRADADGPGQGMRLVFLFGGGRDACVGTVAGEDAPGEDKVRLLAALCDGPRVLSRVDGRVACCESLDDRRLRRLIVQATIDLLAPPGAPRP